MWVLYKLEKGEGGVKISEIVAEEDKKKGKVLEREILFVGWLSN